MMALALARTVAVAAFVALGVVAPGVPAVQAQESSEIPGQAASADVGRRRAELASAIARWGENDPRIGGALARLGYALFEISRYEEAEQVFRRQLAIMQANFPAESIEVGHPLHHIGEVYRRLGRCSEAEPLLQRALDLRQRFAGSEHEFTGRTLESLARCYSSLTRFGEAEEAFRRALVVFEKVKGLDSVEVATIAYSFGDFYQSTFRSAEGETLLQRALQIREQKLGLNDFRLAPVLTSLAQLYRWTERYAQAEAAGKRALNIREQVYGANHEFTGYSAAELGTLYMLMGRFVESEQLKRRALVIAEQTFGPEHRRTGEALANLGDTYFSQGRYAEAAEFFRRSIAILEKTAGPNHPVLVFPLRMHGQSERRLGRLDEALNYLRRAVSVAEAAFGPDSRRVGQTLTTLGRALMDAGRNAEAEPVVRRARSINERALGADSVAVAFDDLNIGRLALRQRRYAEAEEHAARAVATLARQRGNDDFETAWARAVLAAVLESQNRIDPALIELRQASAALQAQMDRSRGDRGTSGLAEQSSYRSAFMDHVFLLWRAQAGDAQRRQELTAEAFEVVQLAQATGTEAAVARMAARFASGTDRLAETVRAREDALERWRGKDATLVQLLGRPRAERDAHQEARLRGELRDLDGRLKQLDAQIARDFPDYAALSSPRPATLKEIQALLRPDEAVVLWLTGSRRTLIMAVRRDRTSFVRVDIGRAELSKAVRDLRLGLDPSNVSSLQDIPPFDTTKAHALYTSILAPLEPLLEGVRNVFVVPDGALQSLPLGVLVTAAPAQPPGDMAAYRDVAWLAKRYATTVLPSIGALKSLRRFARTARASAPFLGIGDPQLDGEPGATRGIDVGRLYSRGAVANADELRKLPPLPETADELAAMARTLGASPSDLYLRARASEREIRKVDMRRYRVVAFATHGLMAGEFSDIGEPALVLSPPSEASAADDGLLTASEIAGLQLDADWVILSACNTAAADGTPGAEGLSGLARSFFYAGSRALLVSHWAVLSDATVKLTTKMLGESAADPTLPRSEAHRRAMLALAADADNPHYAHPMFWAPFVVVGEGGAPARP